MCHVRIITACELQRYNEYANKVRNSKANDVTKANQIKV